MPSPIDALALGFSSGLTCVSSCGAVLLPWLAASGQGPGRSAALLCLFLSGRLLGYLLFAVAAWGMGQALPMHGPADGELVGWIDLLMAVLLGFWAWYSPARGRGGECSAGRPAALGVRMGWPGAALLGFLTGINLCPPFVAATFRAAQSGDLTFSLLFFALFFAGTAVWFLPFAAAGLLRRWKEVAVVGRMTLGLVAVYYLYLGATALAGR